MKNFETPALKLAPYDAGAPDELMLGPHLRRR